MTIAAGVLCAVESVAFRRRDPLLAAVIFSVPALVQALLDGFLTDEHHGAVRGADPAALLDRPLRRRAAASARVW